MATWFDGIENCPVCNAGLPSMRANDGWWGCEDCGFEVESAEQFQKRTGFVPYAPPEIYICEKCGAEKREDHNCVFFAPFEEMTNG